MRLPPKTTLLSSLVARLCRYHRANAYFAVFSVPTRTHAAYQLKALPRNIKKYFLRMEVEPLPPLYEHEVGEGEKRYEGSV